MGSLRLQDAYRVDPNDLRSLPPGVAYIVTGGRAAKVAVARANVRPATRERPGGSPANPDHGGQGESPVAATDAVAEPSETADDATNMPDGERSGSSHETSLAAKTADLPVEPAAVRETTAPSQPVAAAAREEARQGDRDTVPQSPYARGL
jgi:hypothetical protein